MKKTIILLLCTLFLTACADKNNYQTAVLEQMKKDQDVKDYKIDPEYITQCIVESSTKNMPGMFPFDPERLTAYRNYVKMIQPLTTSKDPKAVIEELRKDFGSPKALADAHSNYAESVTECISAVTTEGEKQQK
jgi:hypothetical protein